MIQIETCYESSIVISTSFFESLREDIVGGSNVETLNSGFEFLLRTWTEFCDGELKGLHGFEVRVTVKTIQSK